MSKRMVTLKKAMILLSMGGATFAFAGFGSGVNCVSNANMSDFVAAVANASLESVLECTTTEVPEDFDAIVVQPTVDLVTDALGNFVTRQIPNDPGVNTIWQQ